MKIVSVDAEYLKYFGHKWGQTWVMDKNTHSDSGMVMTLQLTRMVVMMAKPNMGWVKTVRAIRRIGWKGERIHIAFVAENLKMRIMARGKLEQIICVNFDPEIDFVL